MSSPSASFPEEDFREDDVVDTSTQSNPVTVVRIRESFRKPGRVLVKLSTGVELLLPLAAAVEFNAHRSGAVLNETALAALTAESEVTAIVDRALGFMARARRTRLELKLRLSRLDFDSARVREALDRLEERGVLSDLAVAEAEADSRIRAGESPLRIRRRLITKGVSHESARAAVHKAIIDEGYDEEAACLKMARKRSRSLAKAEPAVARRRLTAYLARRGYSLTVVRGIVRRIIQE